MSANAPVPAAPADLMVRIVRLLCGLIIYGFAIALVLKAGLGGAPWDVLSLGLRHSFGWSVGLATIITSIVVLVLWIPLGEKPGIGTIGNALLIGLFLDLWLTVIPAAPDSVVARLLYMCGGIAVLGLATAIYIGARLGRGPRDGLMSGIVRITGWPVWLVRGGLEITVAVLGFLMGGQIGLATPVAALAMGPAVHFFLWLLKVDVTK